MKFTVLPQAVAERVGKADQPLISITDVRDREPDFEPPWKDVLRLKFADLCPVECASFGRSDLLKTERFFSESDALKIFAFVAKHSDAECIAVHCKAGISRSAAVAYFLASKFGEISNQKYFNDVCSPNPHVMNVMDKVYTEVMNK